jgi:hypothetical protein
VKIFLTKVPLGAGQDVGRSCILVTIGSVKNFIFSKKKRKT